MINIQKLTFSYTTGDFHLSIPEFSLAKGEKVAIIGPSGTGKTTLLNLIAGIIVPVKGSIRVGDEQVETMPDASRRDFRITSIGFVFQDFELLDYLNVFDNILHPYRITSALDLDNGVRERAKALAGEMAIGDKLNRNANDLSQGEKQRAAICRALLPNPKLILADEATGNLDPDNKTHILDLLFRSVEEHDATLLAVTHDHELLDHFDRVIDFQDFRNREAVS
jgi:putative ABC transport system ATP-binding protein